MGELIPLNDVVDGEVVDDICACGKPGQLIVDPYDQDVNNRTTYVVMCGGCEQEAIWDI